MSRAETMSLAARVRFEQRATRAWFTERHDGGSVSHRERNNSGPKPEVPNNPTAVSNPADWLRFRHGVWE